MRVVQGYNELFGSKHISTIRVMQNLATLYKDMKEYDKSIKLFEDIIKLRHQVAPEDVTEIAFCKMGLSTCLREFKKYKESENEISEALNLLLNKYGEENLLTGYFIKSSSYK